MTVEKYCRYCGKFFKENDLQDVEKHQKNHERKKLAEKTFGHIANYNERQFLKSEIYKKDFENEEEGLNLNEKLGSLELLTYINWSRSLEGCGYDLKHPTLQEYTIYQNLEDCIFLNGTYINMKIYKKYLNCSF